jgi:hypothetical protein
MQIEFLIDEFSKETNEWITIKDLIDVNLINHEHIKRFFIFNKKFIQFLNIYL